MRLFLAFAFVTLSFVASPLKAEAASEHWLLSTYFSPARIIRTPYAVVSTGRAFAAKQDCDSAVSDLLAMKYNGYPADIVAGRYVNYVCVPIR